MTASTNTKIITKHEVTAPMTAGSTTQQIQTYFTSSADEKNSIITKPYGNEVAALVLPHPLASTPDLKSVKANFLPNQKGKRDFELIKNNKRFLPHQVMRDRVTGDEWLCKTFSPKKGKTKNSKSSIIDSKFCAMREYVASSLLFMEMPDRSPEVIFEQSENGEQFFVYSKMIKEFKGFDKLSKAELVTLFNNPEEAQKLGELYVNLLDIQEVDLKPDNIGINSNGKICPVDKNCCLGVLYNEFKPNYGITADIIDDLPRLRPRESTTQKKSEIEYLPYNWMTGFRKGVFQSKEYSDVNHIINKLLFNPHFRLGVHAAVLKKHLRETSVLPITLRSLALDKGWENYFHDLMTAQTKKFKDCSSKITGFSAYLHDKVAAIHVHDYVMSLRNIKLADGSTFSDRCDHNALIYAAFEKVKSEIRYHPQAGTLVLSSYKAVSSGTPNTRPLALTEHTFNSPNAGVRTAQRIRVEKKNDNQATNQSAAPKENRDTDVIRRII